MKEIWKPIAGYEGYYEVSNLGRVKSVDRYACRSDGKKVFCRGRIMKLGKNRGNYTQLALCKDGVMKTHPVHRLVAKTFIPNPNNLPAINHIDGNKDNNSVSNLEWCDTKHNNIHAFKTGLKKSRKGVEHYNARFTMEQVRHIRKIYIPLSKEFGQCALARKYGVSQAVICDIIHKRSYKE